LLFYRIEGKGSPTETVIWDGRSNKGELVQAATDYPVRFSATDILGNASTIESVVGIDVLVIRDGDRLKIQVPSIVFRETAADFNGIPADRVDNNIRVLRRIAEILNKFRDYKVQVEGHANPVARTTAEERNELQPLSEKRAQTVMNILVEYGVARNRLSSVGMGGTQPVVQYGDRDNWWKNRRVEFILIK
jgi:flagellar motor protein MotB